MRTIGTALLAFVAGSSCTVAADQGAADPANYRRPAAASSETAVGPNSSSSNSNEEHERIRQSTTVEGTCSSLCSNFDAYCTARTLSVQSCQMLRRNLCGGCSSLSSTQAGTSDGRAKSSQVDVLPNSQQASVSAPASTDRRRHLQQSQQPGGYQDVFGGMCPQMCLDPFTYCLENGIEEDLECPWLLAVACDNCQGVEYQFGGGADGADGADGDGDAVGGDNVSGDGDDDVNELAVMEEAQRTVRQYIEANPTSWWEKKGATTTIDANEEIAAAANEDETEADATAAVEEEADVAAIANMAATATAAADLHLTPDAATALCGRLCTEGPWTFCDEVGIEDDLECPYFLVAVCESCVDVAGVTAGVLDTITNYVANEHVNWWDKEANEEEGPVIDNNNNNKNNNNNNGNTNGGIVDGARDGTMDAVDARPEFHEIRPSETEHGGEDDANHNANTRGVPGEVEVEIIETEPMMEKEEEEEEEGELVPEDAAAMVESEGIAEEAFFTDEPTGDTFEPTMERVFVPTTSAPNAEPLETNDEFTFVPNVPTAVPTVGGTVVNTGDSAKIEDGESEDEDEDTPTSSAYVTRLPRFAYAAAITTMWLFGGRRAGIGMVLLSSLLSSVSAQDCVRQGASQCSSTANIPQLNCCEGLTCHPFVGCFPSPRQIGNPCLLTYGQPCTGDKCCDKGLVCAESAFSLIPNVGECKCASADARDCRVGTTGGYNVVIVPAPTPAEETEVKQTVPVPTMPAPVNPPPTLAPVTPRPTPTPTAKPNTAPPTPRPTESFSDLCQQVICFDPNGYCDMNQIGLSECNSLVNDVCECFPPTTVPTPNPTNVPTPNPTNMPTAAPQTSAPISSAPTKAPVAKTSAPVTMPPTKSPTKAPVVAEEEKKEVVTETTNAPTASPVDSPSMPCEEERQNLQECIEANDCDISGECDGNFGLCSNLLPFYCCQVKQCLECDEELAAEAMCISDGIRAMSGSDSCGALVSSDCEVGGVGSPDTEKPTSADTEAPSKDVTNAPTPTPEPTFFPTADDETSSASALSFMGTMAALFASTIATAVELS